MHFLLTASRLPEKKKLVSKLTPDTIGHIPREVSRAVWFFITHGGNVTGSVYSPQYFPSPIATRGLEILIECEFKIDVSKLSFLERLESIIDKNYRDPIQSSVEPICLEKFEKVENDWSDEDDIEILFENDEDEVESQYDI